MNQPASAFPQVPIAFRPHAGVVKTPLQFGSNAELVATQRTDLQRLLQGFQLPVGDWERFVLGAHDTKSTVRTTPVHPSFQQRVFDASVEMKVAVSNYAMHLTPETRAKLFHDLDEVVNVEDWYEEDALPSALSFRDFLKWTIFSKRYNWLSIGFSDEGYILVAWKSERALLSATFRGNARVLWTATRSSPEGETYAAGESTLQFFEREARLYLD
jgi:hypothetical protein